MLEYLKHHATSPVNSRRRPVGPVSRLPGASSPLDDVPASLAGPLLPGHRDTESYGYQVSDFIHYGLPRRAASLEARQRETERTTQAGTRYGCFLPDLTGLARDLSAASLPASI